MNYEQCKLAFEKYVGNYDKKNKQINLKYVHTYQVVELMAELAFRLGLSKEEMELAKIIGLLHDIGRFEQIKQFGVSLDLKTNMDHADFSCHYLFNDHHIRDYGIDEDSEYAKIIEVAVRNHNKFEIEKGLDDKTLLFCQMIRDMDKVDIFRSLAVDFQMEFNADQVSQDVLQEFNKQTLIRNELWKSSSDETLSYLAFVYDINFNESFDILVETDNFDLFLSTVEIGENSEKLWKKIRELCFDKINRGTEIANNES